MGQKYNGVDMDNPVVAEYTKNAIKQHWDNEKICRVIGVPQEVVDHYKKEVERERGEESKNRKN